VIRDTLRRLGRRSDDNEGSLERELAALEAEAAKALPGYEAQFLNRAGDLCLGAGQRGRALGYYGRAIDHCLVAGRYDAAAGICRKLLRISPRAVRTRATLAWLALGKGLYGDARREIDDYVKAATRAGEEARAARQLAMMAQATLDPDLRRVLAEHLVRLGNTGDAERIIRELASGRDARTVPSAEQQEKVWAQVLRAALMGPQELDAAADPVHHPPDTIEDRAES
jgi:predicted Zn-dependent protease